MGYTHYFTQKQSVDPLMWQNFRKHLDKLYHHYLANPISAEQICGGYPDKPIVLCDGLVHYSPMTVRHFVLTAMRLMT